MKRIKVTIGLVPFGGVKYLPYSLKSLLDQDYPNIEYLVLDQEEDKYSASKWIQKERPEWLNKISLWQGPNLWHSGGMNKLMHIMQGEIFIVVSQDMLYPADFVSKMVAFFEKHQQFDFATARLYRWDFEKLEKTNKIDSLGIKIDRFHRAYEVGQGEDAKSATKSLEEIFGASGALMAITKKSIDAVKVNGQVYDENLHYKNDVDLSYRLQWAGCKGALVNDVIIYHDRFIGPNVKKPFWVQKQSLFGDWVFMVKNFSWHYSFLTHLKTCSYLFAKSTFLIIKNPKMFGALQDFWKKRREILHMRKVMLRKLSSKEMEKRLK